MSCCGTLSSFEADIYRDKHFKLEEEKLFESSFKLKDGLRQLDFIVPEMKCAACISKIEKKLNTLPQVVQARANLSLKKVSVRWAPELGPVLEIDRALQTLGFDHSVYDINFDHASESKRIGRELLLALAVAGFSAANIMLLSVSVWSGTDAATTHLFHLISGLIAVPTIIFSGRPFFRSAIKSLLGGRLNMDVPISLAVILALLMSLYETMTGGNEAYFDASVTLLFFLLIGRYLDHLTREKARGAVERLSQLSSKGGILIHEDGSSSYIPLDQIKTGMTLRINAGDRLPVDAKIKTGRTDIDRSLVTGESDFISVGKGDMLEAGVLVLNSAVDVITKSTAENSFLAEMHRMIEVAENGRGDYVRIADRMAQIYAPAVHLLSLIAFIGWMIVTGGDFRTSLFIAIAVLIVTCPCALGLAVPVAHVIGANRLMKNGILMRNGSALERLSEVDTIVFDKTGTLTMGEPKVSKMSAFNEIELPILKALANGSNHPHAKAVYKHLSDVKPAKIEGFKEVPGFGVKAIFNGKEIRFGNPVWVSEISSKASDLNIIRSCSSFVIADNPQLICEFEDSLRPDTASVIQELNNNNLDMQILSGDHKSAVKHTAEILGLNQFYASHKPSEKLEHLNRLKDKNAKTFMIGDGLNDAPSLAAGHVSMAPASACDVGKLTADFVFTRPSLKSVSIALNVAKKVNRIVRENFAIALAYNCIAIPLAMFGFVTPLIAAIAMSASSIVVVANSMRINDFSNHRDKFTTKQTSQSVIVEEVLT